MSDTSTQQAKKPNRSSRWSARQLATMALFTALGIILSFVEFPLLPGTDFLKYDASQVTALLCGFNYGPAAGGIVGVVVAWMHALFTGNVWGAVMNTCVSLAFVLPASFAYKRSQKAVSIITGLVISSICSIAVAILMNLVVIPLYMGVPVDAIIAMILPILLPFNILKATINSVLAFIFLQSLKNFLKR